MKISLEKSKLSQIPTIALEQANRKVYLHSKYDPIREAREWAKEVKIDQQKDYIIFGGGLLYHIDALLQEIDGNSTVLVVEPEKEVYEQVRHMELFDTLSRDSRYSYICCPDVDSVEQYYIQVISGKRREKIKVLDFSIYTEMYSDYYKVIISSTKKWVTMEAIDILTSEAFAVDHMQNLFSNLFFMNQATFVMSFRNHFEGKAAVVVSAGPSLDKNIELLKGNEDKFIIISSGRTLKVLLDHGIRPHFAVSLDPTYKNFCLIQDVLDADVPMVCSLLSNKEIAKNYQGEKIFLNNSGIPNIDDFFFSQHVDTISVNGTVATAQLSLAEYIGCKKVAFIGQDLAYTHNKVHSDSTSILEEEQGDLNTIESIPVNTFPVKGSIEDVVITDDVFVSFIYALERLIAMMNHVEIYDCTEGGALIRGAKIISLEDYISQCSDSEDFYKEIENIIKDNKRNLPINDMEEKIIELEKISFKIVNLTKQALNIVSKNLYRDKKGKSEDKQLKKIDRQINVLTSQIDIASTLSRELLENIGKVEIDQTKSYEDQRRDIKKLERAFYASLQGMYRVLIEFLKTSRADYKAYIENKT